MLLDDDTELCVEINNLKVVEQTFGVQNRDGYCSSLCSFRCGRNKADHDRRTDMVFTWLQETLSLTRASLDALFQSMDFFDTCMTTCYEASVSTGVVPVVIMVFSATLNFARENSYQKFENYALRISVELLSETFGIKWEQQWG